MDHNTAENPHLIPLELSEELKKEEIVTKFVKDIRTNSLLLSLNHKYKQRTIVFSIPRAKKIDWAVITEKFAKKLKACGISLEHTLMIEDVIQVNYEIVISFTEPGQPDDASIDGKKKEICYVHKYTANGVMPLHESVLFTDSGQSVYVYLDTNDSKPKFVNYIERPDKILYPSSNFDSQNPLPYKFASPEELERYLELAKKETLDTLYQYVKSDLRQYVNVDDHYLVILASDIILSYFQEKFPTMHYDIFVGDNGSGKNSAQLAISRLGYRVYYLVSASAPNYFTAYGNVEEGQVTIAEDEVGDLDRDSQKQKILKAGYSAGATVPKTDFPNGRRSQGLFNVYGIKWLAMEELPDSKKTKGIFDRSLIFNFVVGHVDYNIKDIIRNAGDPKFKPLYNELAHLHKLLFAFRLIHYNDIISDIQINLENRNAELTKPSLRLFASLGNAQVALEEIRLALSKFITEKNELKSNSIESKLCIAVNDLIEERAGNPSSGDYDVLDDNALTNEQIWEKCRIVMDGKDIWGKSEAFYSSEYGKITHKRISGLIQSKFKAEPFKTSGDSSKRGWRFKREILDRIALHYNNDPKEIVILNYNSVTEDGQEKTASDASDASHSKSPYKEFNENNSENTASDPGKNAVQDLSSQVVKKHTASNYDERFSKYNNNNNNNILENNDTAHDSNYNLISPGAQSPSISAVHPPNQNQSCSNLPYGHLKCDASDASDAPNNKAIQNGNTKAQEIGLPEIPCIFCEYKDPLEFDLSLHYLEKHRPNLVRLPIGKGSIEARADYAVELSKKKLFESLAIEDNSEADNDDDIEEEEEDDE